MPALSTTPTPHANPWQPHRFPPPHPTAHRCDPELIAEARSISRMRGASSRASHKQAEPRSTTPPRPGYMRPTAQSQAHSSGQDLTDGLSQSRPRWVGGFASLPKPAPYVAPRPKRFLRGTASRYRLAPSNRIAPGGPPPAQAAPSPAELQVRASSPAPVSPGGFLRSGAIIASLRSLVRSSSRPDSRPGSKSSLRSSLSSLRSMSPISSGGGSKALSFETDGGGGTEEEWSDAETSGAVAANEASDPNSNSLGLNLSELSSFEGSASHHSYPALLPTKPSDGQIRPSCPDFLPHAPSYSPEAHPGPDLPPHFPPRGSSDGLIRPPSVPSRPPSSLGRPPSVLGRPSSLKQRPSADSESELGRYAPADDSSSLMCVGGNLRYLYHLAARRRS